MFAVGPGHARYAEHPPHPPERVPSSLLLPHRHRQRHRLRLVRLTGGAGKVAHKVSLGVVTPLSLSLSIFLPESVLTRLFSFMDPEMRVHPL